jgi:predicted phosphodiesterase
VATKHFLGELPFRITIRPGGGHAAGAEITLVHGNQSLNTVYVTEDRSDAFLAKMDTALGVNEGDAVCFGHTHKPWHRVVNGVQHVNTGSVGRPKDKDWRACYALLTVAPGTIEVEFVRVEYDVERAARAIIESDLPDEFAEHLRTGG